ncbi:MAG: aldo/keto reductase [Bacilli bacterium]|nr:aldo/keto reductase [Bacilli bacterium]
MEYRYHFQDQKAVSVIGFGGWQLGNNNVWQGTSFEEGIKLVQEAIQNGVTFFDTAPNYADGNSEKILGEAIKPFREKVIINTKVGHGPNGEWAFSKEGIEASVKRSLAQLQTDYLDSVILHNPEQYILEGKSDLPEVLKQLKSSGKIHKWGVSIDSLEDLDMVLSHLDVDVIEIMFNIIHQSPKIRFAQIKERGILLIIKVPYDSGWLTGKYNATSEFIDIRSRWSDTTKKTRAGIVAKIKDILDTENIAPYALQFILSFPEVSTVIPGTKSRRHLHDNIQSLNVSLTKKQKSDLEILYEKEIKQKETPW